MHCPFWNTGISNSVTVRLFCLLFAHISFFNKDEHQPHEFHIGCFFLHHINDLKNKYWLFFQPWMPAFDMIVGPWPMEKMANQFYFNNGMWHRFITGCISVRWTHLSSVALHWSVHLLTSQTLSHFINKFYWELTSWEVDLVGVDFMIDLVGMNLGFVHFSCVYQFFSFFLQ